MTVDGNNVIKNTIYEYSEDDTWRDVFDDLCDGQGGGDLSLGKADTIDEVCLTHKLTSADVFHPDLEEPIKVALNFDKHLKYVTFKVKKFHHTDENSNHEKPKTSAFTKLMHASSACEKKPQLKRTDGARFTGVYVFTNST